MARGLHAKARWVPGAFDTEELRQKYQDERDKWLRPDCNAQYLDVTGNFERFAADPYLEPTERTRESPTLTCSSSAAGAVCRWQSGSREQAPETFSSSTKRATSAAAGTGTAIAAARPSPP